MQTNLLFKRILMISFIIFSLKSFGRIIVLNINNGNSDGSLFQMNENVVIGDKIRFTNNFNFAINQQNNSFISGPEGNIPINIQPGSYYEFELTSDTQTMFTFVHMNMVQNKYYNSRINLTFSALGVNETLGKTSEKLMIFPNPCTDVLHMKSGDNMQQISLFDSNGRLLFDKKTVNSKGNNKDDINMSAYTRGRYFLRIRNADGSYSKANVIKK
ncbi:T9SS type A sorting domain-containing protein [Chryseobacterium sediminis]|uniref:T9SS type A sorting domain-containing protein n=2 Tax=Chryseobacterium sediminis TaxID=1679494 RepID=A0A5B2UDA5_9FLAO|nr:T9SS type A sorting domain-containing protein [Chryseobacterium sediminis]